MEGCTVASWGGPTSTPADQETRTARHEAHNAFDPLWKARYAGGKKLFRTRGQAYRWLSHRMKLHADDTHIGMFSLAECRQVLEHVKELTK